MTSFKDYFSQWKSEFSDNKALATTIVIFGVIVPIIGTITKIIIEKTIKKR